VSLPSSPDRSGERSSLGEGSALGANDYGGRFDDTGRGSSSLRPSADEVTREPLFPGAVDIDEARSTRTRFPAPYRSAPAASRPAVPSRSGSPEMIRLVDRYREATARSYAASDRGSIAPILDRYGRSSRGGADPERPRSSFQLNAERYAAGPVARRSAGVSASPERPGAAPSGARERHERSPRTPGTSSRTRSAGLIAREASAQVRAKGIAELNARDPQAARRVLAAGNALARGTTLGLAAGVSVVAGPAAGGLVLGANRVPTIDKGYTGSYWGYGYYPWWGGGSSSSCWSFGFGWSSGCGWPSWCWSPLWTCSWYPYYWYGYSYCYPYYSKPYYYYPFYYSTVVHHVYDDDPVVVVVDDDEDEVVYVDEPVGEAVGGAPAGRPIDSPLKLNLSIAADRYLTLGDRAFREGRYTDAAQFYAKAVEFAPDEGVMHLVLADALFATGDYHYAAYSIRRALELDPALAEAVVDKHEFYADPAEFDRHLAVAELYVGENPTDADAKMVLAANYLFGNRPAAAVELLEREVALSLRADTAATLILAVARETQYGAPAPAE
jgi:hypothetical protein